MKIQVLIITFSILLKKLLAANKQGLEKDFGGGLTTSVKQKADKRSLLLLFENSKDVTK